MKALFFYSALLLLPFTLHAQKVAHINTNELLELMPEKKAAEEDLLTFQFELNAHLQKLTTQFQEAYSDIQEHGNDWSPVILKLKEDELLNLQEDIEEFQRTAQKEIERREIALLEPIINKAKNAINRVASREGFDYVIDASTGSLLVMPDNRDILELVRSELGIVIID